MVLNVPFVVRAVSILGLALGWQNKYVKVLKQDGQFFG
jgi:hypothetical protein